MEGGRTRAVRGRARGRAAACNGTNGDKPSTSAAAAAVAGGPVPPPDQPVTSLNGHQIQPRPTGRRGRGVRQQVDAVPQAFENLTLDAPIPGPAGDTLPPVQAVVTRGSRRQGPTLPNRLVINGGQGKQGTKGDIEPLKSNYFEFAHSADFTLYQYRVDFRPDPDVTSVRKGLLAAHREELGAYVFDGTVLFTVTRVDENVERISTLRNTEEPVQILIKLTRDLIPSDPEYVQFMNIVIRKVLSLMNWKVVNRDYFDPTNKATIPEHKMDIWPGYSTSIRQHENGILMNVELLSKVMRKDTALSLLEIFKQKHQDYQDIFRDSIIGKVVITAYNNQTYRIDDVDWNSNPDSTFDMKGTQLSFRDYYYRKYNINVGQRNQPLLVSNPSKRDIRAGNTTVVKLIPALCNLTGIDDSMRRNFQLMKAIAAHTKVNPRDRIQRLESGFLGTLTSKQETRAELDKWNMKFNPSVVKFLGRRLPQEIIYVGGEKSFEVNGQTGDFTHGLKTRNPLLDLPELKRWVLLYPKKISDVEIANFIQTLIKASSSFRFMLPSPKVDAIEDDKGNTYAQSIEKWVNEKAQLVMCVVPNDNGNRYETIKKKCYVHRSIPNQLVLARNVSKTNLSVCSKIGIQLACKMGGSPWTVKIPSKGLMVAGFDVCHDTNVREKSFGALVASLNDNHTRYASFVQPHRTGEEISPYIGMMMEKAVVTWMENRAQLPGKIVLYRDGIGEGNYHYAQEQEIKQILVHLKKLYGDQEVPLVYIVVSKRINTRLFRAADNGNPLPGTVADSCVTTPHLYDFFLVSQSVREGTVSPTSYVVLYDAVNMKPDVVQQLTYKMCHLYFNWSGTIRVPAPVQYAHKLAFLSGQHLHTVPQGAEQSMGNILYYL